MQRKNDFFDGEDQSILSCSCLTESRLKSYLQVRSRRAFCLVLSPMKRRKIGKEIRPPSMHWTFIPADEVYLISLQFCHVYRHSVDSGSTLRSNNSNCTFHYCSIACASTVVVLSTCIRATQYVYSDGLLPTQLADFFEFKQVYRQRPCRFLV